MSIVPFLLGLLRELRSSTTPAACFWGAGGLMMFMLRLLRPGPDSPTATWYYGPMQVFVSSIFSTYWCLVCCCFTWSTYSLHLLVYVCGFVRLVAAGCNWEEDSPALPFVAVLSEGSIW